MVDHFGALLPFWWFCGGLGCFHGPQGTNSPTVATSFQRFLKVSEPEVRPGRLLTLTPPNLPVRMSHTSKEQSPRATHHGRITSKQSNNILEVPDYPQSFPSILMLNLEGNQERTKQQNSQRRMLQIPKICVMDQEKEDDVHNLLPQSTRCQ